MRPLEEWLQNAKLRLSATGVDASALEAQLLAAHVLNCDRAAVLTHPEWPLPEVADVLLRRRLQGEPLAYLLGYREFYGRRFMVTPDVLIPRQETETLIEAWLHFEKNFEPDVAILDLGTGSGCIGITLKLERPSLRVTLADISEKALAIAEENALTLGADVSLNLSDGFKALHESKFRAIVTNPPYVGTHESLPDEIRNNEPHQALFAGESGLDFYNRLAREAASALHPNGLLITEIGDSQSHQVQELFVKGGWTVKHVHKDLLGTQRVFTFSR